MLYPLSQIWQGYWQIPWFHFWLLVKDKAYMFISPRHYGTMKGSLSCCCVQRPWTGFSGALFAGQRIRFFSHQGCSWHGKLWNWQNSGPQSIAPRLPLLQIYQYFCFFFLFFSRRTQHIYFLPIQWFSLSKSCRDPKTTWSSPYCRRTDCFLVSAMCLHLVGLPDQPLPVAQSLLYPGSGLWGPFPLTALTYSLEPSFKPFQQNMYCNALCSLFKPWLWLLTFWKPCTLWFQIHSS